MSDDSDGSRGNDRVTEIYVNGLAEVSPDIPIEPGELEAAALEAMDETARGYVDGGAGSGKTAASNEAAFDRWRIEPEMLRGVESRDLSTEVFGTEFDVPVMCAPIGCQSILHDSAERASAEGAANEGVPLCLSTVSSTPLEEVSEAMGDVPAWFQLYWSPDRELTASFIDRAEQAGYEAIVVTVDTPIVGWRPQDLQQGYLHGTGIANYTTDDVFRSYLDHDPEANTLSTAQTFLDLFGDASLTWDDLEWLHDQTDLPVVVKGILSQADARRAVEHGADGVVVSNHGGRQVDRSVAALEALPGVVDEIGDEAFIGFDSGIRSGADILAVLALGADLAFVGRPYVYGLTLDGAEGVATVLANLLADFDLSLGLSGYDDVTKLDREALVHESALQ